MERPDPSWDCVESNSSASFADFIDSQPFIEIVDDSCLGPRHIIDGIELGLAEQISRDRGFTSSARPDDQADIPRLVARIAFADREHSFPSSRSSFRRRNVEHGAELF